MESPCIGLCTLMPGGINCMGCGRTTDEIMRWIEFTDAERARIMSVLPERMRLLDLPIPTKPSRRVRQRQR
jgi:predicted Fe-S protein YdhL (DUF1289 family)